jgi:hypothetical protein
MKFFPENFTHFVAELDPELCVKFMLFIGIKKHCDLTESQYFCFFGSRTNFIGQTVYEQMFLVKKKVAKLLSGPDLDQDDFNKYMIRIRIWRKKSHGCAIGWVDIGTRTRVRWGSVGLHKKKL